MKAKLLGKTSSTGRNYDGQKPAEYNKFPVNDENVKSLRFSVGLNESDVTFGWNGFHNTFTVYYKHPGAT